MERMYEIGFEHLKDGTIRLEQQSGVDDPSVICLSSAQLKYIARQMCGSSESTAERVRELERMLSVLTTGFEQLVCDSWFRNEVLDYCKSGLEVIARFDGLLNLAWEMDGNRLLPEDMRWPKQAATKEEEGQRKGSPVPIERNATKGDCVADAGGLDMQMPLLADNNEGAH